MEEKKKANQFSGMSRKEMVQEARKQILHSAVLALAALIVIGIACYAWFVSTNKVTGIMSQVFAADKTFELACVGSGGAFSNLTPGGFEAEEGDAFPSEPNKKWTFGNQTIQWGMTGGNNFGNFTGEVEGAQIEAEGIRPGLDGTMSFYVIPKENGPLAIQFQLKIVPLELTDKYDMNSDLREIAENDNLQGEEKLEQDKKLAAVKLLHGHLLFAGTKYQNGQPVANTMEIVDYTDGSFEINFGEVEKGKPIPLAVYWFWPSTMEAAQTHAQYGTTIAGWMNTDPDSFFYEPDLAESDEQKRLVMAYDQADKYIGDMIDAIILQLDAQKVS